MVSTRWHAITTGSRPVAGQLVRQLALAFPPASCLNRIDA
jgi:hypothetical protein